MPTRLDYQKLSAAGMRGFGNVHQYIEKSGLELELINLVYLRISQINGCMYCIDMHARDLLTAGVPVEKLMLLSAWHETEDYFSDRERAALQWAESLTFIHQTHASDEDYSNFSQHFSEKERSDLTVAISLMNAYNRIAIATRQQPEAK